MRVLYLILFSFLVVLAVSSFANANDPIKSITAKLSRDTIGLDEQAILEVKIETSDQNVPPPKLPTLAMFEVYSQGRSSNTSIVNGVVSSSVTYRYILLPQEAGVYPIGGIAVVHKNKRYDATPLEITVLKENTATKPSLERNATDSRGESKDYFMEATVDKNKPFVNEQVTLTLKIYFGVQTFGSPELSEPSTTGFWTEVLGNETPYYQKINNRNYRVIERKYALFPTQTGKLTIGRAILTATVAKRSRRRDPFDMFGMFGGGEEVKIRSKPIDLEVKPLPQAGRPKGFTGTIGKFKITATPDKRTTDVNQPVSVAFEIKGTGNIKSVAEPTIPELDVFRVYRASSSEDVSKLGDKIGGTKTFEEVFIPNQPGTHTIPGLEFSYFDPQLRKYRTLKTKPIDIHVRKPEGYVASPDVPYGKTGLAIGSDAKDIRYIKETIGDIQPVGSIILLQPIYLIANALPVLLLGGVVAYRVRRQKFESNVGYARSRTASRTARKKLSKAKTLASTDKVGEFYAELTQVIHRFIADKLNISPHGLTSEIIAKHLNDASAEEELIESIMTFLKECDFARFAPTSITNEMIYNSLKSAEKIMSDIEGVRFD